MNTKKKSVSATDYAPDNFQVDSKHKPATKQEVALLALLRAGEQGLNTLEANKIYGDTCLHTVVSIFRNRYGLVISSTPETIINRAGTKSHPYRYRIVEPESINKANKLIDKWQAKRGIKPLHLNRIYQKRRAYEVV